MSRRTTDDDLPRQYRLLEVPDAGTGMRLDQFLASRFGTRSRTELVRGIRRGLVTDEADRPLRPSATVAAGQRLRLYLPGIAPSSTPPPFPPILYEDDRVVVLDKPPGLPCHPGGTAFTWAVVGLARTRWPDRCADLVHRLDKETSGALVLTKDREANAYLKRVFKEGGAVKEYVALCRGHVPWEHRVIDAPIGPAEGPIRIQRAVRPDGLSAFTEAWVEARTIGTDPPLTRLRVRLHTGRTHQIRVHLAHIGHGIVGDRMYGVPPAVFLHYYEEGLDDWVVEQAGAPRHALHAASIRFPHPDGTEVSVEAPLPADMARWWADPALLPCGGHSDRCD
ncbi:MAG: RluA family pseudouridine synthase [Deltaproteobacteria bacterium]|nr:RluA family pseudouridine synthase [Deltaproteobacteria bacterium]